jgi:hypothetical protein
VQAAALGELDWPAGARAVVRRSFEVVEFLPGDAAPWDEAYRRVRTVTSDRVTSDE